MATSELAVRADASPQITRRMLDILKTGDLGPLTAEEQLAYYLHECARMGLDPAARPLEWIRLSGKLVLYAKRTAGDMLAAKHGVSIALVTQPEVRDFGGAKILYAVARATMPNGRFVDDLGTAPAGGDVGVAIMKCATRAMRRATLRLCGWGGLDESELDAIPARAVEYVEGPAPTAGLPAPVDDGLEVIRDALAEVSRDGAPTVEQAAAIYVDYEADLGAERCAAAFGLLLRTCPAGTSAAALKRAIAADKAHRARAAAPVPAGPVAPANDAPAPRLDPVAQAASDFALARSREEIDAIAAEVAKLALKRGSEPQKRLATAYKAALARLAPRTPDDDGGAPPPRRVTTETVDGDAYEGPDGAAGAQAVSPGQAWRAHAADIAHIEHLIRSFVAHEREFGADHEDCQRAYVAAAARLGVGSAMTAMNLLRAARRRRAA